MPRVLIVDDEPRYRTILQVTLAGDGHDVQVADSGHSAIALGSRFRPDVLVTDWMLKDRVHGLHVAAALRAVRHDMVPVLVTAFPSQDLAEAAADSGFAGVVEKPIDRDRLRAAVARPSSAPRHALPIRFGVIEIEPTLRITYTSASARQMLGEAAPAAQRLDEVFEPGTLDLGSATGRWQTLPTRNGSAWRLRTQETAPDGRRFVVVSHSHETASNPLAEVLLGSWGSGSRRWPRKGRALVVDDNGLLRGLTTSLVEQTGTTCYAAGTHEAALRLLEADPGIEVVLLDYEMPCGDIGSLIERIRALRPNVLLVGNSGGDHEDDFQDRGVDRYLMKPWRIEDLLGLIARG